MSFANTVVAALLRSPLHGVLSGSTDLVRYTGRRTGRQHLTPTQYARRGDELVILVARPETKSWWRNFTTERELDVLVRRQWLPMTARAVRRSDEPDTVAPLLDVYLRRFPKVAGSVGSDPMVVWCRPRPSSPAGDPPTVTT